jgi:rhodanese-related sulfurtransferase
MFGPPWAAGAHPGPEIAITRYRAFMGRRTIAEILRDARASLRRLQPEEAFAAVSEGAVLIDVRCESDRAVTGGIPGALAIPLSVLEWRLDPASESRHPALDGSGQVILICAEGYSSSLAARRLHDLGYDDATDVIGGFEAWAARGLPVDRLI